MNMRRKNRRGSYEEKESYSSIIWVTLFVVVIASVIFFIVYGIYNNKVKENNFIGIAKSANDNSKKIDTLDVSSELGKNINEVKKSSLNNNEKNEIVNENILSENNNEIKDNIENEKKFEDISKKINSNNTKNNVEKENLNSNLKNTNYKEKNGDLKFVKPIKDGIIYREFAKDKLVYSDTLQEWIIHPGIDVKVSSSTDVMASETGQVESIKNDPRYGLTIILKHNEEYKTVYSNLLTTEFVKVGDNVKKGQIIAQVGSTASFEVADEPHLHFEIIKNNEKLDPEKYFE